MARDAGVIDYPTRWHDHEGRVRDVSISAQMIDFDGEPASLAYVVDVAERRRQAGTAGKRARFRSLFEEIPQVRCRIRRIPPRRLLEPGEAKALRLQ